MKGRISPKKLKMNKEALKKAVLKERKKYYHKLPSYIYKLFDVDDLIEGGRRCYRILPRENFNGTYIVYLYGSSMCRNITNAQWSFISRVCLKTGAGLFVPMYPLAPENCCKDVFNMLEKAYSNFTMGRDVEKVVLMGDSSGAGLALSLAMVAWKEGLRKPDQLIMLSPVLDTEFFDHDLEREISELSGRDRRYFYTDGAKDFINSYWVKDYAVRTEYTSPYYGDYTDLCDDVVVFSSREDIFGCYAKAFYQKAKLQGVNVRFFEFEEENHNFLIHSGNEEQKKAFEYLIDVICGTYNASLLDIYPLKLLSDWTKKYPDVIKDEWASKFIYENRFDFSGVRTRMNEYNNLRLAATYSACDSMVRRYIKEFPNCTIVNMGCRLDNMFERLDNGRIQWYSLDTHNIMSVRRFMYGERPREKTIGRSLMDFSWIDDIVCNRNQGIMFVCNDAITYMTPTQVKKMINKIWEKFPGTELVFTAGTIGVNIFTNMRRKSSILKPQKKKMAVSDAQKVFSGWRADYRIMEEEPVMKYLGKQKKIKFVTRFAIAYNLITYNHKIIHVRLGSEAYDINI